MGHGFDDKFDVVMVLMSLIVAVGDNREANQGTIGHEGLIAIIFALLNKLFT